MSTHSSLVDFPGLLNLTFFCAIVALKILPVQARCSTSNALYHSDTFSSVNGAESKGWTRWSHRDEISPKYFIADQPSLGGDGSLGISGTSNSAVNGCWRKPVGGIEERRYYRFEAFYTSRSVAYTGYQIIALLDWRGRNDERVGQPEYVPDLSVQDGWQKVGGTFRAPQGAESVRVELYLRFSDQGTVWWDGITLEQVPKPLDRFVRVGTINCFPRNLSTAAESVGEFCRIGETVGEMGCDIVCMGEVINLVGVKGSSYIDAAEPIPGPSTERLGKLAKKWNMYIVAGIQERDGHAIYCTAVLIDRQGKIVGKYRKVTIPREELEGGVTPGNSYPVFDTDFGRIGIMICFDLQYVDPARALALQGAEIIFLPVWGGNPKLPAARCVENQVYMAVSGYDMESNIFDPWGNLIAAAEERPGYAIVEINLSETHYNKWLGNMRHRFFREMRPDIHVPGMYK